MMRNISAMANSSEGKIRVPNTPRSYLTVLICVIPSIFFSPSTLWQGQFFPFQINTKAENGSQSAGSSSSLYSKLCCTRAGMKTRNKKGLKSQVGKEWASWKGERKRRCLLCIESWEVKWLWPRQARDFVFIKSTF